MKRLVPVCLALVSGLAPLRAGPTEAAIVAAMRLSEAPNYTWVATVSDDARTYDITGRTTRGGFTRVRMPVINSIRRRLGRSVADTDVELIFRGNVACVIACEDGWRRPDELPPLPENDPRSSLMPRPGRGLTGALNSGVIRSPRPPPPDDGPRRGYSNLQLAVSHPHEELGVIVSSYQELAVEGDVVTGTLTDLGAQLLLVRDGQDAVTPLRASGTFKLWLRDGQVARYQVRLEGVLSVTLPTGTRQVAVHQMTETVLKDIGTTVVDVPAQARAKLGE